MNHEKRYEQVENKYKLLNKHSKFNRQGILKQKRFLDKRFFNVSV